MRLEYLMITVVTPCYNQAEYLESAIQSVRNQTETNFEYLLIDDGSTDNTWEIMQKYEQEDERIRCIQLDKQPNVGVVLNRSVREANGDYWVWCPADDRLHPHLLKKKTHVAQTHPDAVMYSDWECIDGQNNVLEQHLVRGKWTPKEYEKIVWIGISPIGFTGIWIPITVFDRVGNFPANLSYSEDFEWMIRATIHHVEFICVPEILYQKRLHPNTTTRRNIEDILKQGPKIKNNLRGYQSLLKE